jgi:plastocyanin
MKEATRQGILLLFVTWLATTVGLHAQPQVTVTDSGFSFSPDPVNIFAGQTVVWVDNGTGPYTIFSGSSAWSPISTPGGIQFTVAGTYSYYDDVGDQGTVHVAPHSPPTVVITSPANNAVISSSSIFTFAATASDADAVGLSDVQFYVGTNLVADISSTPYQTGVTNLAAGSYTLTAVAADNVGAVSSNSVSITVQGSAQPQLTSVTSTGSQFQFAATGLTAGKTNILQSSGNLASSANWTPVATNVASGSSSSFSMAINAGLQFFRLLQLP